MQRPVQLKCLRGSSAQREVLLGFAPASTLHAVSFADILDEAAGRGYQRRFNAQHSLDFRKYIQQATSTTIPLTFNLRPRSDDAWRIRGSKSQPILEIGAGVKVLAQVDCQHRLGFLGDTALELPFMAYIGLTPHEEMEVFNVINTKARGLSSSLLDLHKAQLSVDLASERPELFIALFLKDEAGSPWYQQLDLGGSATSGLARRASLRTIQKAVRRFLNRTHLHQQRGPEYAARVVLDFWVAVATVLNSEWARPRKSLITKGIGVYALMDIAADIYSETPGIYGQERNMFLDALSNFALEFNWTTDGPLKGLGGEGGVREAVKLLRDARRRARLKVVASA